jgi:hypothetical protein
MTDYNDNAGLPGASLDRKDSGDIYAQLDRLDRTFQSELEDIQKLGLLNNDEYNQVEDDADDDSYSDGSYEHEQSDLVLQDLEERIEMIIASDDKEDNKPKSNNAQRRSTQRSSNRKSDNQSKKSTRRRRTKQTTQTQDQQQLQQNCKEEPTTSLSCTSANHDDAISKVEAVECRETTSPSKDTANTPKPAEGKSRKSRYRRMRRMQQKQEQNGQNDDEPSNASPDETVEIGESEENTTLSSSNAKDVLAKDQIKNNPDRGKRRGRSDGRRSRRSQQKEEDKKNAATSSASSVANQDERKDTEPTSADVESAKDKAIKSRRDQKTNRGVRSKRSSQNDQQKELNARIINSLNQSRNEFLSR